MFRCARLGAKDAATSFNFGPRSHEIFLANWTRAGIGTAKWTTLGRRRLVIHELPSPLGTSARFAFKASPGLAKTAAFGASRAGPLIARAANCQTSVKFGLV